MHLYDLLISCAKSIVVKGHEVELRKTKGCVVMLVHGETLMK